jgi:hypothetical protein
VDGITGPQSQDSEEAQLLPQQSLPGSQPGEDLAHGNSIGSLPAMAREEAPPGAQSGMASQFAAVERFQSESSTSSRDELKTQAVPRSWHRPAGLGLIAVSLLIGGFFVVQNLLNAKANSSTAQLDATQRYAAQSAPLAQVSEQLGGTSSQTGTLTVNGLLNVTGSLVLTPTSKPANAALGQLYIDQTTKQLGFFNGSQFVYLQGGGNTYVTNQTTNAGAVTNVTNVTNVTQGSTLPTGTLIGSGGTAGSLAMFTGPSSVGNSMITQNGNALSTGSGAEQVSLGSLSGNSVTALQGGTGNLLVSTGSQVGSSGNITIQTGDSSTTAAGNVSIDTGNSILSGTVIADKTFEDGTDNMGDGIYGNNSVVTQSIAQAHGGTHSLSIAVGSNFFPNWAVSDGTGNPPYSILVTPGHTYALSAWVRADTNSDTITAAAIWSNDGYGGGGFISSQTFGTVTDITSGWRKIAGILTAPAGSHSMGFYFSSSNAQTIGEVHYFDDITLTDLSGSSSSAAINVGTTNAQMVNIGNSAMFAPTTIYGGGINLTAGSGFLNMSGSNIVASSGGATYSTTTGALDITGATSSTWKIAGSGGTGGDLAIASGNAGGNANGGNLLLQSGAGSGTGGSGNITLQPAAPAGIGSGGSVMIGNGGGSSVGYTKAGQYDSAGAGMDTMAATKFTPTAGGTISSVSGYFTDSIEAAPNNQFGFAIYADNSGQPGNYIASSTIGTLGATDTWLTLPISATLTASTPYWLVYWQNSNQANTNNGINYDNGIAGAVSVSNTLNWQTGGSNGWPSAFPTGGISTDSGVNMSIYATYTSSGPALTLNQYGTMTQSGAAVFQDPTDSTQAVQIQNTAGAALFTADTEDMTITIAGSLTVTANLTVDGHVVTGGSAPSIAAAVAACTTPTVNISGDDTSGTITVTTGTGCSVSGDLASITFSTPYGATPHIALTPIGGGSAGLNAYLDSAGLSATGFAIGTGQVAANSTTYQWDYSVEQ